MGVSYCVHCPCGKQTVCMLQTLCVPAADTLWLPQAHCACCKHTVHVANIPCMLQTHFDCCKHTAPAADILCMLQTKCVHAGMQ